ncbi:hypothetical protein DW962_11845, partial [Blautia sp. AM46-5]
CGRFYPNEGGVAGYGNRMRVKYTAKWGLQIAEMIFQTRSMGGQRGQDNFKLAANFGYNSRGSADPRESLRNRRILKLALTAHTVLPTPGARLLLLSTDISTTPALLLHPIVPFIIAQYVPHPALPVANTQKVRTYPIRTDSLLLAPLAEMRSSP